MISAAEKHGITVEILFLEYFTLTVSDNQLSIQYKGKEVSLPLFAVMRCYDEHLSRHLELMGIRLFNSCDSMNRAQDKLTTHQLLALSGIPTPKTFWGTESYEEAAKLLNNSVFILKSPVGSKGEGVYLIKNETDFNNHRECLVQAYIEESKGRDIRVWVIGNRAVAAVERYNENSYLSNYAQGGKARKFNLTPEIEELAVKSSRALGLEFSGVDILYGPNGSYYVCEVNGNAGFRTLWLTNKDIDMLGELFSYIKETILESV